MFRSVFDTAKRILSRSPSFQGESQEAVDEIPRSAQPDAKEEAEAEADMVTTRRGTDIDSVASTPASSVRKTRGKRNLEAEAQETPTASKRRRKVEDEAPTTEDSEKGEEPDFVKRSMPTRAKKTYESAEARTPVARRGSPKIMIPTKDADDDAHESETASSQVDMFFTPAQQPLASGGAQDEREGSATPRPVAKTAKATPAGTGKRGRPRKNPAPASPEETPIKPNTEVAESPNDDSVAQLEKETADQISRDGVETGDEDAAAPSPTKEPAEDQVKDLAAMGIAYEDTAPDKAIVPPRRHKRFGSEEPADVPETAVQAEPEEDAAQDHDDDGSDSDEAPEMVTTSAAASKAKAAAEEKSRARQAQEAKEEKRRQERADRIAQEQAEKREREEKKARNLAKKQAKAARRQQHGASSPARDPMDVDMDGVPDLLPASVLEAAGDRRPPTPPPVRGGKTEEELRREKMNRHIKFLERGEKPIKDVKKGKVNVSVLSQRNLLLAPKVNRDTKNIREHWLKGREADRKGRGGRKATNFKKMERRSAPKGFLRGGDDD